MSGTHGQHDRSRASGSEPSWYGSSSGGGSSSSGSASSAWPDAPDRGPSPYGPGSRLPADDVAPAYLHGRPVVPQGRPLQPGQSAGTGLSIASLVLGILTVLGGFGLVLPPVIGVVLGHMGLRREPEGRGMAIAGLVMNYIGLGIMALILMAIVALVIMGISLGSLGDIGTVLRA